MSTQYNGVASNVVQPSAVSITSSTNTSPIVVTTTGAHGLTTGDGVDIIGHSTNYTANGFWPSVIVLSATTFSITGSVGVGVGGATGGVQAVNFGTEATGTIPSDGDDDTAASVDVMLETLADRTAFLLQGTGRYKLVNWLEQNVDVGTATTPPAVWSGGVIVAMNTWQAGGKVFALDGCQAGDVILVELFTTLYNSSGGGASNAGAKLFGSEVAPGFTPSYSAIVGTGVFSYTPGGGVLYVPAAMSAGHTMVASGAFYVQPYVISNVGGGTVGLAGDYRFRMLQYRGMGIPQ